MAIIEMHFCVNLISAWWGMRLTEYILFGRAILVYIPAQGQGDIAWGPTHQYIFCLLYRNCHLQPLNMTIKVEIKQNSNIDQPAGQDITLYIMQMEQSHWLISLWGIIKLCRIHNLIHYIPISRGCSKDSCHGPGVFIPSNFENYRKLCNSL